MHAIDPRRMLVRSCTGSHRERAGVPPDSTLPSPTPPATRGSQAVLPDCSTCMTWETTRAELNAYRPEERCTSTSSIRPVSPARLERSGLLPVSPRHKSSRTSMLLRPDLRNLPSCCFHFVTCLVRLTRRLCNERTGGMKVDDCTACEKGKYSLSASRSCSACPVGKYNSLDTGVSECTVCPPGKYAGNTGLTVCTDCPTGKYEAATGMRLVKA